MAKTATARAIDFVALQCFQCSTMQVKQHKRSSNKWTCVVCNEKQSVLKVFARSHMAKDVRGFVQSFNMSRRFSDHHVPATEHPRSETEGLGSRGSGGEFVSKAKRIDWMEYLDEDGAEGCGTGLEDEREAAMIVTELPDGLFKRAKLSTRAHKSGFPKGGNGNLYKPCFPQRNNAKSSVEPSVQRSKRVRPNTSLVYSPGKCYQSESEDHAGPRKAQMTEAGRESRWSRYMTQEDNEFQSEARRGATRRNSMDETSRFGCDLQETAAHDHAVEDDIHPDFI
ncbi:hypothetical protein MLD38_019366 [Melastoma candidum]|uniref:Uncharacterized protein n=1 Tax=Melastoma candidum TaxID=119954 RepID=A0ACB9QW86_9MYRT|nr:hypothetical protein MLD38_019366 [Melastoma candidum]